jgi:hypothetical protein
MKLHRFARRIFVYSGADNRTGSPVKLLATGQQPVRSRHARDAYTLTELNTAPTLEENA